MTLNGAVIGCGEIALAHLDVMQRSTDIEIVGVCDSSPATAEYFGARYSTRSFTDAADLLAATLPDVVHVLTPPASHRALSLAALAAGADVICEKPAARDSEELDELLAAAETAGRLFVESQNYRFNDGVRDVLDAVGSGRLGEVTRVDVEVALPIADKGSRFADPNLPSPARGLPGGAIHDFLPHMAYLALLPLGFPTAPDEVWTRWDNRSGIDVVGFDSLVAVVHYGRAIVTLRFAADTKPDQLSLRVSGTGGTASTELFNPQASFHWTRVEGPLDGIADLVVDGWRSFRSGPRNLVDKVMQKGPLHGFETMIARFYEASAAARAGRPAEALPVPAHELRACLRLSDALVAGTTADELVGVGK